MTSSFMARAREFEANKPAALRNDVRMISGCEDHKTSADVSNVNSYQLPDPAGRAGGACTATLLKALYENEQRPHETFTFVDVLTRVRKDLRAKGLKQIPQLTSTNPIDVNDTFELVPETATGTRRAVLIGINYVGQRGELRGCHNDVLNMQKYIQDFYGFQDADINILMDDGKHVAPTKQNIINAYKQIVAQSKDGDAIFLHYSGHGSRVKDLNGDEDDGYDECLCPLDCQSNGMIIDDDLYDILVRNLAHGVHMVAVYDCCHSGTVMDLPYIWKADGTMDDGGMRLDSGLDLDGMLASFGGAAMGLLSGFGKGAKKVTTGVGQGAKKVGAGVGQGAKKVGAGVTNLVPHKHKPTDASGLQQPAGDGSGQPPDSNNNAGIGTTTAVPPNAPPPQPSGVPSYGQQQSYPPPSNNNTQFTSYGTGTHQQQPFSSPSLAQNYVSAGPQGGRPSYTQTYSTTPQNTYGTANYTQPQQVPAYGTGPSAVSVPPPMTTTQRPSYVPAAGAAAPQQQYTPYGQTTTTTTNYAQSGGQSNNNYYGQQPYNATAGYTTTMTRPSTGGYVPADQYNSYAHVSPKGGGGGQPAATGQYATTHASNNPSTAANRQYKPYVTK